ncbi:MAG: WD40/YVTN/BNR-like repeat-containing protein [Vicinamibacterales bacterium]
MATRSDTNLLVLAGTGDGLYLYEGTCERSGWSVRGPYLEGRDIANAVLDPRDGRTIWVAASGNGSTAVYRSPDRGATWQMAGEPFDCDMVWHVEPGHAAHPRRVYAGVRPAGLFVSDDSGETWQSVDGLNQHPSTAEWWEGGGGKMLHTILTNPSDPDELTVAISVAGVFRSLDGGATWQPSNEGTLSMAEYMEETLGGPARHPGVHRCVHKVVRHPSRPAVLYQQNHDGVYATEDGGASWVDIAANVRDKFGFVIGITRDGSVYVVPQDMNQVRFSGQLEVYRRREGAGSWDVLTNGLPEISNLTLYREGMATDNCLPGGVYFGASAGDIYHTINGGETWSKLAAGLPPVRSMSCEHFE